MKIALCGSNIVDFYFRVARFQGGEEVFFSAEADLSETTTKKVWTRPPITMDFQVTYILIIGYYVYCVRIDGEIFEDF